MPARGVALGADGLEHSQAFKTDRRPRSAASFRWLLD
jgi:hypothetical protein